MNTNNRFRDPIHGFIHLSDIELQIVDTPEFQRLRHISQLALTNYVYPGANHTRFEHSLGVLELASKAFTFLKQKHSRALKKNFKKINLSLDDSQHVLRFASLLHDIGHFAFSHAGEAIYPDYKHEEASKEIILNSDIANIIKEYYSEEILKFVCMLIIGDENTLPELRILQGLISSQLDADRTDYLIRDSYHCGVGYGNFDYNRLLETLTIKNIDGEHLELAIKRGGIHVLEALILARSFIFSQIYFHRTRRLYDIYLQNYINFWNQPLKIKKPLDILKWDDIKLWEEIRRDVSGPHKSEKNVWAKRLLNRKQHHHVIFETTDYANPKEIKYVPQIFNQLREEFKELDFLLDSEAHKIIHSFYTGDKSTKFEEFFVEVSEHKFNKIEEESNLLTRMPNELNVLRIYLDCQDSTILNKIRSRADEIYAKILKG